MNIPPAIHAIIIAVVDALKFEESTCGESGRGNCGGEGVLLTEITEAGATGTGGSGTKSGSKGERIGERGALGGGEYDGGAFGGSEYGGDEGGTVTLVLVHTCIHGNIISLIRTSCTPHEQRSQSMISSFIKYN